MHVGVLTVAALSGLWTMFLALGEYMSTTGLIDSRMHLAATVPFLFSLCLSIRFVTRGGGWGIGVLAIGIAGIPFALFAIVAIQQTFFPYGLPTPQ